MQRIKGFLKKIGLILSFLGFFVWIFKEMLKDFLTRKN